MSENPLTNKRGQKVVSLDEATLQAPLRPVGSLIRQSCAFSSPINLPKNSRKQNVKEWPTEKGLKELLGNKFI